MHMRTSAEGRRPTGSQARVARGSPVCGVRGLRHGVFNNGVGPPGAVSIEPRHAFRAPPQFWACRMLSSVRGRQPWQPMERQLQPQTRPPMDASDASRRPHARQARHDACAAPGRL